MTGIAGIADIGRRRGADGISQPDKSLFLKAPRSPSLSKAGTQGFTMNDSFERDAAISPG